MTLNAPQPEEEGNVLLGILAELDSITEEDIARLEAIITPSFVEEFQDGTPRQKLTWALLHKIDEDRLMQLALLGRGNKRLPAIHNIGEEIVFLAWATYEQKFKRAFYVIYPKQEDEGDSL